MPDQNAQDNFANLANAQAEQFRERTATEAQQELARAQEAFRQHVLTNQPQMVVQANERLRQWVPETPHPEPALTLRDELTQLFRRRQYREHQGLEESWLADRVASLIDNFIQVAIATRVEANRTVPGVHRFDTVDNGRTTVNRRVQFTPAPQPAPMPFPEGAGNTIRTNQFDIQLPPMSPAERERILRENGIEVANPPTPEPEGVLTNLDDPNIVITTDATANIDWENINPAPATAPPERDTPF